MEPLLLVLEAFVAPLPSVLLALFASAVPLAPSLPLVAAAASVAVPVASLELVAALASPLVD